MTKSLSEELGLKEGQAYIIGRKGPVRMENHIYINSPTVSRPHAEMKVKNGRVYLRDMDSTNGIYIVENDALVSFKEGYVSLDRLSWDAYNESADLIGQIESYRERFGHHPASVHADTIYRTRKNRDYCKERGIRLSGKPPGRPKKETEENKEALRAQRKYRQNQKFFFAGGGR